MQNKNRQITRTTILSILFSIIFVAIYILIVSYTYSSIENMAHDTMIKSIMSSAASFSKYLSEDMLDIQHVSKDFEKKYAAAGEDDKDDVIQTLFDEVLSERCSSLIFVMPDGQYISSTGKTGISPNLSAFENLNSGESAIASLGSLGKLSSKDSYIYSTINIDGKVVGHVVGIYNYSKILSDTYASEYYSDESIDLIINKNGKILLNAHADETKLNNINNFFDYITMHRTGKEQTLSADDKTVAAVSNIIVDGTKYAAAYAEIDNNCGYYIARLVPSRVLFAQTGNLLALLTAASLIFFFGLLIIAYKFYKSLNASSEKIRSIAYVDPLTGYPNFEKFKEDAKEILENSKNENYYLCCADMIGFRYINDAFGYDEGDRILIKITETINELLIEGEICARISGDKFIILTQRDFNDTDKEFFLYKLTDRISTIQPLAKAHIRLEVQMGIYPVQHDDIKQMSVNAMYDRSLVALYSIEHVDTGVAVYDVSIHNEQIEKKNIESKMHEALQNGEFRVYIQPKYRTNNAKLAAGEALIRWIDPEKGIVPPAKFIPLFEENRFVHDVDLYVMEVVSRFLRMRLNEGLPVVPISLNISPVEISMPNFRESYISIKKKYDIPDKLIELEFTEGIFFENEDYFKQIIEDFQKNGFTCSIDDFGSGYSSLNILKSLPVDTLKLDRLFFRESDNIARDRSVVRSVVAMARSLNIKTVAEGVETLDAVEFLKLIGCTYIQGYIYARPMPLTEFEERLDNENIDKDDSLEFDFDKFESIPLDMPLNGAIGSSFNKIYSAICEINTGGNIYHMYYPGDSSGIFERVPERGFYSSLLGELAPKFVHPKDLKVVESNINPINLVKHFKTNKELNFEYRHLRSDGSYSWIKIHIIKANGGKIDSQIYFAYFNVIDNYKETEEQLVAFRTRFSTAFSKFNGAVFEIDTTDGKVELLESHSYLLASVKSIKDYETLRTFIRANLLHPDDKEKLAEMVDPKTLCKYFEKNDNDSFTVEVLAKPSRKVSYYNCFRATFSKQPTPNKLLLTIEDISEKKAVEAAARNQHYITEAAFANSYDEIYQINLVKDTFHLTKYLDGSENKPQKTEGKYSLFFDGLKKTLFKEEDTETLSQVFSLEALQTFYSDTYTSKSRVSYERKYSPDSKNYEWFEALLIAVPRDFKQDDSVYIFIRSIEERKETEKNLNEYAHRLSYSLAMFDYAYSVDTKTEKVEIIGGLCFDSALLNEESLNYSDITMLVKNSEIDEDDRSAFRRFTYLDELVDYFSSNPATITKYFNAHKDKNKVVEVSIIYGAREEKITLFIRKLDRADISGHAFISKTAESEASPEDAVVKEKLTVDPPPKKRSGNLSFGEMN